MEYYNANSYFKDRFGSKVYKAAVSLDVTCPNRDGSKGTGGCIFCSEGGSGEFSANSKSVTDSINEAIERVSRKTSGATRYIAYFQSFTNTYCAPDYLRRSIDEAMNHPDVCAVSIATRPDCLPDGILSVLDEYNRRKPIFVELGLQTIHEDTANWIRRGYRTGEYDEAVRKLKKIGINVITHVIFGLKDETEEMMLDTVRYACDKGTDGIKFTCLYVLKGTDLEEQYRARDIKALEMEEYFDIVAKALEILPSNVVVHRLTGDGPKKLLIAPEWTANKRNVVNYINRRFGN